MPSQFGDLHDTITKGVDPHHKRISEIDRQIAALDQEKSLIRLSAVRELQATLKLSPDLIGVMVAACR